MNAADKTVQNIAHQLVDSFYTLPEQMCLSQGDILSCEKLKENLPKHHHIDPCKDAYPYFFSNYSHAIILNADCDIFAKDGRKAKVKCIQIAAVVEASQYIKSLLLQVSNADHYKTRLIDEKNYSSVVNKFQSLINNQEKTYFYLPENWNIGFKSAHIARLDTSISLQINSVEKYKAIQESRISATLQEPYKSKIGENYANLFDRTGLTDVQDHLGEDYELWLSREMEKYFIKVPDWIYRRAIKDVKLLADQLGSESADYENRLIEVISSYASQEKYEFEDLPAFRALKKIIEAKMDSRSAEQTLKQISKDQSINQAFAIVMTSGK